MIARYRGGLIVLCFAASITGANAEEITLDQRVTISEARYGAHDPIDWSGFYFGGFAGYSGSDTNWSFAGINSPIAPELSSGIGGVLAGYSHELNEIVVGVEADAAFGDWSRGAVCPQYTAYTCQVSFDWLATLRATAGIPYERMRTLFFISGGLAAADVSAAVNLTSTGANAFTDDAFQWGWAASVGFEVAVRKNISLRGEALAFDLGDLDHSGTVAGDAVVANVNVTGYQIRGALVFRFP